MLVIANCGLLDNSWMRAYQHEYVGHEYAGHHCSANDIDADDQSERTIAKHVDRFGNDQQSIGRSI